MGLFGRILSRITGTAHASPADWAELEAALLEADLGPELAGKILHSAQLSLFCDPVLARRIARCFRNIQVRS
jgi:hypothetical protein